MIKKKCACILSSLVIALLLLTKPHPVWAATEYGFRNVSLDAAEQQAIVHAPTVLAARARVAQAAAAYVQAKSTGLPTLFGSYVRAPQGNPPGPTITSRLTTGGIQVALNDLLSVSMQTRQAAATLASRQADERAAEIAEKTTVATDYFAALRTAAIEQARNQALMLARRQSDAAQIRMRAGDAPRIDVLRAAIAVTRAQVESQSAHVDFQNGLDALATEIGMDRDEFVLTPVQAKPLAAAFSTDQAAREAELMRPEIASAELTAKAASYGIEAAKHSAFPPISFTAGLSTGTDSGVRIAGPSLGLQLTIPVPALAHARVQTAQALEQEAEANAAGLRRTIVLEARTAARAYASSLDAQVLTAREEDLAVQELGAAQIGYRNAAIASLDVTAAQNSYVQALIDALTARYDAEKAYALLLIGIGRK